MEPVRATVVKRITGRLTSFEVGEAVLIHRNDSKTCMVERGDWTLPDVGVNCIMDVPVEYVEIYPNEKQ